MPDPREPLPDGWIRTPLPPMAREDGPDGRDRSWFARTGEPAPTRQPRSEPAVPAMGRIASAILVSGVIFALAVVAAGLLLI